MDDKTRALKGSPSRDLFKRAHKQLSRRFYACDIDFVLIEKYPPRIAAVLDFKLPRDMVTFSEVIAYNHLMALAPVYIVQASDPENGPFEISQYTGGDYKPDPPVADLVHVVTCENMQEFEQWEAGIRTKRGSDGTR